MRPLTMSVTLPLLMVVLLSLLSSKISRAQESRTSSFIPSAQSVDDQPGKYMIIEGDILVPVDFYEKNRLAATWETKFWPDGIVPYEFDANVTAQNRTKMLAAMAEWKKVANVNFRLRSGESDYIHIQSANNNSSSVGRQGGQQFINITSWNSKFVIAHELGHALGYWHEQSRPDRDNFVQINWNNIQNGQQSAFGKRNDAGVYGPYDFDSVMHYDQCAFSIDCPPGSTCNCTNPTITVLPPNQAWQSLIGQSNHLSQMDTLTMSFLYPEDNWRFVDKSYTGLFQFGTFLYPFKEFTAGAIAVPTGGTLWIQPGTYSAVRVYDKRMTVKAPLGGVVLK